MELELGKVTNTIELLTARATSAAPSYFPAKFIRGLGFLQDGGAGKHNNPIDPAEWESEAIWDSVPDLAVSSGWNNHLNRVHKDERHKYFRINIALDREPPLDDVSKIPELEDLAATFLWGYDFSSITQALFAGSFFFELHRKPVAKGASVICSGSIRCRSPDTRALIERILQEYPEASFTMKDGPSLGYIGGSSLCATCGHYRKVVNFKIYHVDQSVSIQVQFNRLVARRWVWQIRSSNRGLCEYERLSVSDHQEEKKSYAFEN
ncbi:metabolic process [Ascochyta rabiei]|uniref:Metabolic process n=1 Tax=Didymella rabiei TaxID=5454 RepID=A0A163F385_DIDRA|nr:metabolic process [Ascochyta rabiei]